MKNSILMTTAAALLAMSGAAFAQQAVTATTDLNVRQGPGPQYPVIGAIAADGRAEVTGCLQGSKWCQVSFNGGTGWAYSDYLMAEVEGREVVYTERVAQAPTVTYQAPANPPAGSGTLATAATGAVAGALIGGPIGAAIGGVAGAATGSVAEAVTTPDARVRTYVDTNRVDPVYLDGEVVVGARLPQTVKYYQIPDYKYSYVYLNGQQVLVEPESRRIVYVMR